MYNKKFNCSEMKSCNGNTVNVDVDVEWMYELRQSPLCPPQTYDLHSNDTIKFLVYYSTALRLPVPSNCALKS